jgi:hypothetical protein
LVWATIPGSHPGDGITIQYGGDPGDRIPFQFTVQEL